MSIISHDLKGYFSAIDVFTQIFESEKKQLSEDDLQQLTHELKKTSTSGSLLLENLLDWSRYELKNKKLQAEKHNLNELIIESIKLIKPLYEKKEIDLIPDIPEDLDLFVDKNAFSIVVRNILSNALKFSYPKGKVVVTAQRVNSEVTVSFRDNGSGMNVGPDIFQ